MRLIRSITVQTTLIYTGLFVTSVALLFSLLWWQSSSLMQTELDSRVERESQRLMLLFENRGLDALRAEIDSIGRDPGSAIYWLVDAGGVKLNGNLDRVPALVSSRDLPDDWIEFDYLDAAQKEMIRGRKFVLPDNMVLFVGRNSAFLSQLGEVFGRLLLVAILLIIALGLLGGRWLAYNIDRRLNRVNRTIAEIMAGDLTHRIPLNGQDDAFDHLADHFNRMLDRIGELMHAMRDVSDNIAHDLRTPLNRIKNRIEIIAKRQADGQAIGGEDIATVMRDIDDVIVTFNALLSLSRLESGATPLAAAASDLVALVRDLVDLYEPLIEEAGVSLHLDLPDTPVAAHVSAPLLVQAMTNILDNALKYGLQPAGQMRIALTQKSDAYEICFSDDGAGIAPEEYARVLRRFGRLDAARASAGSGLGLPLVHAIATRHGGALRLEQNLPHGLVVIISLPRG
jgi:signal transduction histidine kinase